MPTQMPIHSRDKGHRTEDNREDSHMATPKGINADIRGVKPGRGAIVLLTLLTRVSGREGERRNILATSRFSHLNK